MISLSLGTIITIGIIVLVNNNYIFANRAIWRDFDNMEDLVTAIRNGEKDDNNINWKKFQGSDIFHDVDEDVRDCLRLAHKIGNNLGDYEIVHCFNDVNYFKNKYSKNRAETNASLNIPAPETNASLNIPAPETNASLNIPAPETNDFKDVGVRSIRLNVSVGRDPISRGENQVVTVIASNSSTGKILDRVFIKLEIKNPIGVILKNYTGTNGNMTRNFRIGEGTVGTFTILATVSQAGTESAKSLTFNVQ